MCRICGSEVLTKDCCPTPLETGLTISRDEFKAMMIRVWELEEAPPDYIVRDFYSDWMSGVPVDAETYLRRCEAKE